MRNAGTKSKAIQIFGVLSFFLIWGFEDFVHSKTETEFVKYSDLNKPIKGDGSRDNPYQIAHPLHLKQVRDNLSSHFKLVQNLDLGQNKNFGPIGIQKEPFKGTFDGAGKIIKNLKIQRPDENGVGFFGYAQEGSVIRNVRLQNIDIVGKQFVGGLVGMNVHKEIIEAYLDAKAKSDAGKEEAWKEYDAIFEKRNRYGGKIEASYATGKVEGESSVGGLVGWNDGTIQTSYATGKVLGKGGVGGLVGWNDGTIQTSYATGKVLGKGGVGGLVGSNDGTIQTSYATGEVEGKDYVGGLVGGNVSKGTIQTSYAAGKVNGKEDVGGLVGGNGGTIKTSYATGKVEGEGNVGGLVGGNYGTIKTSYAAGKVEGKKQVGGLVGWNIQEGRIEGKNYWLTGSAKEGIGKNNGKISHIEGKSKFEMILKELDWDLEVWEFPPGKHPRLRWQSLQ